MENNSIFEENRIESNVLCGGSGICSRCKLDCPKRFLGVNEEISSPAIGVDSNYNTALNYGIAIDIGTTTLAFALLDICGRKVLDVLTCTNPQRKFGLDVISRIDASNSGNIDALQQLIVDCININIDILIQRNKIMPSAIERMVVAGNTTMIHLLLAYSCEGMGRYPFAAYSIKSRNINARELLNRNDMGELMVYIMPMVSAFVGGDIVSGIYACGMAEDSKVALLIDLGTNGELVLGNKERLIATSTAAGPAFEGGNISCGIPSISGAIYDSNIIGRNRIKTSTIGGKTPIGICGSGLISLIADILECRIIDNNGSFTDEYFESGFPVYNNIVINQKDIREVQLGKSAIRTGIELLCDQYGIKNSEIECIYIAGGFGSGIDIKKAMRIGLIPADYRGEILAIGNSSLRGASECVFRDNYIEALDNIASKCEFFAIAELNSFNDKYLEYMSFDKEV